MYAWFADRETARQYATFVRTVRSRPGVQRHKTDRLIVNHAVVLGGLLARDPSQCPNGGYVVPMSQPEEVMTPGPRRLGRQVAQQILLTLLLAGIIWAVGAFTWFVEEVLP